MTSAYAWAGAIIVAVGGLIALFFTIRKDQKKSVVGAVLERANKIEAGLLSDNEKINTETKKQIDGFMSGGSGGNAGRGV